MAANDLLTVGCVTSLPSQYLAILISSQILLADVISYKEVCPIERK